MAEDNTIFHNFNARSLDAKRVGETFVQSPYLSDVAMSSHTAVVGPRGSGKTTLLKMLTIPALLSWNHPRRKYIIERMDYVAVYVPASIMWSADYRAFSGHPIEPQIARTISISLFRHAVLTSIVKAWHSACSPALEGDIDMRRFLLQGASHAEPTLVRKLSEIWGLQTRSSTINGLMHAINKHVRELQRAIVRAAYTDITVGQIIEDLPYIQEFFLDDVIVFLDVLAEYGDKNLKIALCFDEIEITPNQIADTIIRAVRSVDQRIIIKYSSAPYISATSDLGYVMAPMEKNDFKLVLLSSYSANDVRKFSEELFRSLCMQNSIDASVTEVLGNSFLEANSDGMHPSRYDSHGSHQKKFRSLYLRDPSFRSYASARGLKIDNLSAGREETRAADVRKVLWPVLIREEYLFQRTRESYSTQRRIRSKDPISDLYTGAGALLAICEGNPRWIIGLLQPMIQKYKELDHRSIPRSFQKKSIQGMISAYFALLSTIPAGKASLELRSLVELVDRIGIFFKRGILGIKFNADPVLSFKVDDKIHPDIRDLVGRGLTVGVFVTSQRRGGREAYNIGNLRGMRIRVSNLLAPHYRLPLVGGRQMELSTILAHSRDEKNLSFESLFGENL